MENQATVSTQAPQQKEQSSRYTSSPRKNPRRSSHNEEPVFLRKGPAANYLGLGLTKLDDLCENDPTFPRKIRLSRRCVGFRRADLDAWLNMKAEEAAGEDFA